MKAKAKDGTTNNIKPITGGGAIATLTGGQYVFGDLSTQGTDIINFDHDLQPRPRESATPRHS